MAYVLVVNAEAGSSDRDAVDRAAAVLAEHDHAQVVETSDVTDLDGIVRELESGDVLVACGGDGSIHAAVSRIRAVGRLDDIAVGVIPMGTGNDLAGCFGLSDDPEEAARVLLDAEPQAMDLLVADDDQICINALHAGVGVDAAARADALKESFGKVAYPLGAIAAGATADGWALTIEVDDEVVHSADDDPVLLLAIMNATTFGGGTPVAPHARPDDGEVDVVISTATGPAARAAFGAALTRGTHLDRDDVTCTRGSRIRITGDRVGYNVDGELDEDGTTERSFHVEPGAWTLIAPRRDEADRT